MSDRLTLLLEGKIAFGLWTTGDPGRGVFGDAGKPPIPLAQAGKVKSDFCGALAEVRVFNSDPAVQQAAELAGVYALAEPTVGKFSTASAAALKTELSSRPN